MITLNLLQQRCPHYRCKSVEPWDQRVIYYTDYGQEARIWCFHCGSQSDDPQTDDIQIYELSGDALAEATLKQKPKLWTKRMLKVSPYYWLWIEYTKQLLLQLYLCLIVDAVNLCIYGYDRSLMSSINSYPQYREYFGFNLEGGTPATGIVFAIYPTSSLSQKWNYYCVLRNSIIYTTLRPCLIPWQYQYAKICYQLVIEIWIRLRSRELELSLL